MRIAATLLAGAFLVMSSIAFADAGRGEFGGQCAYGLSIGKQIKTDCKVSHQDDRGFTLCFMNEQVKNKFMSSYDKNLSKARENFGRM